MTSLRSLSFGTTERTVSAWLAYSDAPLPALEILSITSLIWPPDRSALYALLARPEMAGLRRVQLPSVAAEGVNLAPLIDLKELRVAVELWPYEPLPGTVTSAAKKAELFLAGLRKPLAAAGEEGGAFSLTLLPPPHGKADGPE
ncbi:hypothetical protein JCM10213_006684 [Rhodosporidiobolus nylandii]